MNAKTKLRLNQIALTIKNSKEKISNYSSKMNVEKDSKKREIYKLRKEIEQLRVEMKNREAKIIFTTNN